MPPFSIRQRLALLIGALLLAVTGSFSWAAYQGVRRAAVATVSERLGSVTEQLTGLLQNSTKQLLTAARMVAADRVVRAFLQAPDARSRAKALAALRQKGPLSLQVVDVELRNARGERLLSGVENAPRGGAGIDPALLRAAGGPDSGAVGRFRAVGDSVLYPVAVPVGEHGRLWGYLVEWRRLASSPQSREQTNQLIGAGAALFIGNTAGDVWTDLLRVVPRPPVDVQGVRGILEYERLGIGPLLAAARPVPGAPWTVLVEFPRAMVTAPAHLFLKQLAMISLIILVLGLASAWVLSGTITGPLQLLTDAAGAVARGDYSHQVRLERRDELERLAEAFNTMSAQVRRSQARLEDEVRERTASERTYRSFVENSPYGICRSTPDGRLLAVNPALVAMLGYDSETELLQRNLATDIYIDREDRARVLRDAMQPGHLTAETAWRRKDGRDITVRQTARVVRNAQGDVEHFDVAVEDMTQHRLLEDQVRQAQKMEAVGRLAGGVAHDFNNLLTAILGSTDLLLETLPSDHPGREEAEETRKAALRAADLTRQLLAFSRQQVLAPRVLSLNAVVANMDKILRRLIGEDVDLRTVPARDLGAVRADPGQLEQVIINLALNARDAMPGGGKLTIETANVDLDQAYAAAHGVGEAGAYVMLAVSDTGTGMDAGTKSQIFEPFFTTKPRDKGTGLGLATVYGIVKQSGGHIWVYSEPRQGTTFKIYLPRVCEAAEPTQPASPAPVSVRGSETILVVEDQAEVRNLTRRVLESRGYTALVAASGTEALKLAEQYGQPIHLLVTDVIMPGMSGREVGLLVAAARPSIKILYVSGYTDESIVHHGVLEPGIAFLQKPFTPDALVQKVREVLDSSEESGDWRESLGQRG